MALAAKQVGPVAGTRGSSLALYRVVGLGQNSHTSQRARRARRACRPEDGELGKERGPRGGGMHCVYSWGSVIVPAPLRTHPLGWFDEPRVLRGVYVCSFF